MASAAAGRSISGRVYGPAGGIARARRGGQHIWTDAELALLFELREDEGWEWDEIAKKIGVPKKLCASRYHQARLRRNAEQGLTSVSAKCPQSNWIDREKRNAARLDQDLTASTFGDPPPGYSALDKRRAQGRRA